MKNFSKIEIAVIKRTAQNVSQFTTKKAKIDAKIAELEAEKASLQPIIDSFQGPIKEMTGGYTTEDLIVKEVVKTGKFDNKTGKEILQTRFSLKYPDTVVPVEGEETAEAVEEPVKVQMPEHGNDYDADMQASESENPWE